MRLRLVKVAARGRTVRSRLAGFPEMLGDNCELKIQYVVTC